MAWMEGKRRPIGMWEERQNEFHNAISTGAGARGQLNTPLKNMGRSPVERFRNFHPDTSRNHEPRRLPLPIAYQTCERRYLPLEINGKRAYGLPDNALIGNAMTEEWAQFIGARIDRSSLKQSFVNAKGQPFEPIGTTQLLVSIPGPLSHGIPEKEWKCSFAVVSKLAAPLVLGAAFLQEPQSLTSLAHLLVKKTLSVTKRHMTELRTIWRFMHMDVRTQNLDCFLDDEQVVASLDTGSDIDAVSLDYVRSRNWELQPLPEDKPYVLLANDEFVKLAGYVETTLKIRPRCDSKEQSVCKKLFVLDGLVCDVVLGDSTIETLSIFDEYNDSIFEAIESEGMDAFRMIQWIEKIDQLASELEHLVLNDQDDVEEDCKKQAGWNSIFRWGAQRKRAPVEAQGKLFTTK